MLLSLERRGRGRGQTKPTQTRDARAPQAETEWEACSVPRPTRPPLLGTAHSSQSSERFSLPLRPCHFRRLIVPPSSCAPLLF